MASTTAGSFRIRPLRRSLASSARRRASRIHGAAAGQMLLPGGQVEHPRRDYRLLHSGQPLLLLQGEQIEQHLQIQPVPHIGQVKGLVAGLVVHDPDIELTVMFPAVHPVHQAGDGHGDPAGLQPHRGAGSPRCRIPAQRRWVQSRRPGVPPPSGAPPVPPTGPGGGTDSGSVGSYPPIPPSWLWMYWRVAWSASSFTRWPLRGRIRRRRPGRRPGHAPAHSGQRCPPPGRPCPPVFSALL